MHTDPYFPYQATYEAFGKRVTETGATLDRQKSNTKDEDVPGYANEGFRFRDLETGAFLSQDPAGFVDGPNLYTYVKQNPWTGFDPEGLFVNFIAGAAIGAGIDIGAQLLFTGKVNSWASVGISAAMGATGVGLGEVVAKSVVGGSVKAVATRAALNAAGSAAISTAGQASLNVTAGKPVTENLGTAAVVGGVLGAGGSLLTDGVKVGAAKAAESTFNQASLSQKLLANSNAIEVGAGNGGLAVGAANAAGLTTSNLWPVVTGGLPPPAPPNQPPTESAKATTQKSTQTTQNQSQGGSQDNKPEPPPKKEKEQ